MKALIALALCVTLVSCQEGMQGSSSTTMKTAEDSVSYAIGMNIGNGVRQDSININPDILAQGIRDAMAQKTVLNDTQVQAVMGAFQQRMMAKQQEKMMRQQDSLAKAGEGNKARGEAFLAQNKTKEGVVTLPSGLQYQVQTEGTGPMPKATDNVEVHYHGTLIDGTVFDSSVERGQPVTFNVSGVIPGWTEALQLMKVGSKWKLFIPAELAYGVNPQPGSKIGPNDALIFEVELLAIKAPDANAGTSTTPGN